MRALSVLLPVRDAGPYLAASLASLWRQTFPDFEVVAVDDGSSDGSGERLERAAAREPRLRVLHTPPRGIVAALNLALASARSPLVARQDADDLSHRERFRLQREFLVRRRAAAVVGCRVRLFPAAATGQGMRRWVSWHNALLDHDAMAREILIDSPLAHGSALLRREWLERVGGWADRGWAEDLDLWLRLIEAGGRLAKLPRVLYAWRQHPGSATHRDPRYARARFLALRRETLGRGLLANAGRATLIGTGRSFAEWCSALARGGIRIHAIEAKRPARGVAGELCPPIVLVYGASPARARWRTALAGRGLHEGREFVFVA